MGNKSPHSIFVLTPCKSQLKQSQNKKAELNVELKNIKKSIKMRNCGSSKLDEILAVERTKKEKYGLRYNGYGKSVTAQTMFVKARTFGVKKDEDLKMKASAVTPARTLAATSRRKPTVTQGRMSENR